MPRFSSFRVLVLILFGVLGLAAQGTQQQGPVIIPKKTPPTTPAAPAPPPLPKPEAQKPQFNFNVTVPDVEVPVTVQTKSGMFVPNLTAKYFQVYEDGVLQKINSVSVTNDAPITVVMLIEFRNTNWYPFLYDILEASYTFTGVLQPQDWVALVTYDLKPTILVDFTHNKQAIYGALNSLSFANFSEADMFDSVSDTVDRLEGVQGHKIILLISTGFNTFSHMNWDQLRKKLAATQDITIYTVSMAWSLEQWLTGNGYGEQMAEMNILQGNNELRYIAESTGGRYYEPRFEGAYGDVFRDIAGSVRDQYIISYTPTNRKLDGTTRKVRVELVGPDGKPLRIVDQKGKLVKYDLNYRSSYISRHVVE